MTRNYFLHVHNNSLHKIDEWHDKDNKYNALSKHIKSESDKLCFQQKLLVVHNKN